MDNSSHGRQQRSTLPAADFTLSYQPTTRCIERAPCSAHMCTTRTTQLRDFMRSQSVTLVQRRDQTRHEEDLAKPVLLLSSLSFSYLGSPLSRPSLSRPLFPTRLTIIDRWRREKDGKELGTRAQKRIKETKELVSPTRLSPCVIESKTFFFLLDILLVVSLKIDQVNPSSDTRCFLYSSHFSKRSFVKPGQRIILISNHL